jgi:hypothetical protein
MNVSRRGFLSFLAGAAVPTIIAGGIIRAGGLIKPPAFELIAGFDLGDPTGLLMTGQKWFLVGYDEHGNVKTEEVPWDKVISASSGNLGWNSPNKWRSISGMMYVG